MNGLDHFFQRSADFGVKYVPGALPVVSMGIGTLEVHPIDLLGAYGTIADGGVLMPRTMILSVVDSNGKTIYPDPAAAPVKGKRVISAQTAYIITDILAGNTDVKTNPFWGKWAVYDGATRRPAAYKTGTTSDNRDVHAYGFLAPPKDPKAPALAVGVWMGNSNNEPNTDTLSLSSSAPLWSRIMRDVSHGIPIATWQRPGGIVEATVDAFSGLKPGASTTKTVQELFIKGTQPTYADDLRRTVEIDSSTGLLWQDGCAGPKKTVGVLDFSNVDANFPTWQKFDRAWAARAARGAGVAGRAEGHPDVVLLRRRLRPVRPVVGRHLRPRPRSASRQPTTPPPCIPDPLFPACPSSPVWWRWRPPRWRRWRWRVSRPTRSPAGGGQWWRRRRLASRPQRLMIEAPSPPSPRSPGRTALTSGWLAASLRTASRRAPVPRPWMIRTLSRPASPASSR